MPRLPFSLLAAAAASCLPWTGLLDAETPRLLVLDSGALRASIAPEEGGELSSLEVRRDGNWQELLYRGNDYSPTAGWSGRAPTLWPAVGRTVSHEGARVYSVGGKLYQMPGHGFARDHAWQVERYEPAESGGEVEVALQDSPATRRYYPFGFRLGLVYRLSRSRLALEYRVQASQANEKPMPFSIGNHITFRTPLVEGGDPLAVVLSTPSTTELLKENGVPTGKSRPRSHAAGVALGEWERLAAVSLTGYEGRPRLSLEDPAGLTVRLEHEASRWPDQPFIQFNVWGDPAGGYISPEPWAGLQNSLNLGQGLVELAPGEEWTWRIELEVEPTDQE